MNRYGDKPHLSTTAVTARGFVTLVYYVRFRLSSLRWVATDTVSVVIGGMDA